MPMKPSYYVFLTILLAAYAFSCWLNDRYGLNHSSGGGQPSITQLPD